MHAFYELIESGFSLFIEYLILLVELIGVVVLARAVVLAIIGLIRKSDNVRVELAEGFALALEFKMGGELLRTVIVREWKELMILGAVMLLRAAMTFLLHWEIKTERRKDNGREERIAKLMQDSVKKK